MENNQILNIKIKFCVRNYIDKLKVDIILEILF